MIKACVIASDQSPSGYELAERYYVSNYVEEYGKQWMTMDLAGDDKEVRDTALATWGENFFLNENNWAAPATGDANRKRVTFKDIEDVMQAEPVRFIYSACNEHVHAGPTRTVEAADFSRDYIFNARPELNLYKTSWVGQTSAFLVEFSTMEILRWVTGDAREWDRAFSAAEFIHQISRANSEFARARSVRDEASAITE